MTINVVMVSDDWWKYRIQPCRATEISHQRIIHCQFYENIKQELTYQRATEISAAKSTNCAVVSGIFGKKILSVDSGIFGKKFHECNKANHVDKKVDKSIKSIDICDKKHKPRDRR